MPYGGYGGGGGFGGSGGFGGGRGGGGFGGRGGGRGGGRSNRRNEEPKDPEHEQFRKLFVGGLNYDTPDKGLKDHFEKWGEIVDCIVMRDPNTKKSRGFGFITFLKSSSLDDAQKCRPHTLDGREVETKRAMPRDCDDAGVHQSVTKMFVGGMKDDTTENHVREVFEPFGEIKNVVMVTDKESGKSKGFCFVDFMDYDSVDKCVLKKRHNLNERNVEVKKAVPRDQMEAAKQNRGGGGYNGDQYGGGYGNYGGGGYDQYGGGYGGYGGQQWGGNGGYGDYRGYGGNNQYGGHGHGGNSSYGNNGYGHGGNSYNGGSGYGGSSGGGYRR